MSKVQIADIYHLAIEVTRRCNMECAHCLRGDAQAVDMTQEIVDRFVDGLEEGMSIGDVTLTGGEPSLNVPIMQYVREAFARKSITVNGFYVVTNGKKNPLPLMTECLNWFAFVEEQDSDICGLALSSDEFHEKISWRHLALLRGLSFFHEDDKKHEYGDTYGLLMEGQAIDLEGMYEMRKPHEEELNGHIENADDGSEQLFVEDDTYLYLNAKGDLVSGCNWSYESQDGLVLTSVFKDGWTEELAKKFAEANKESEAA